MVQRKKMAEELYIFISYFVGGVSFRLTSDSYITSYAPNTNNGLRLLAHELCHGFSNEKAREAYRNACNSDGYLNRVNWFLNEFLCHPGDEEEFVQAIDHAIAVKNGLETYDEAMKVFESWYLCSVPIAIILFEELHKLREIPYDMNEWICTKFSDGTVSTGGIEAKVNRLIPGYSEKFRAIWEEKRKKSPKRFAPFTGNS